MPIDTNIILQQTIAAHQLSDLNLAKNLYLSILKTNAQHADANHKLDLLYISVEQPADALPLLRRALEGHPQIEQFGLPTLKPCHQLVSSVTRVRSLRLVERTTCSLRLLYV